MKTRIKVMFFSLSLFFTVQFCFANTIAKKQISNPIQTITVQVVYGDKTTTFSVVKAKTSSRIDYSNNLGAKETRKISIKDFDFLKNKILKISGVSNDRSFCDRSYISVQMGQRESLGCIGAPNPFARGVQDIANLVSVLF